MISPGFANIIQDEVAAYLAINGDMVKERNLHIIQTLVLYYLDVESTQHENLYTLPIMWSRLKVHNKKDKRAKEIEAFNQQRRWIKGALS